VPNLFTHFAYNFVHLFAVKASSPQQYEATLLM